MSTYLITGGAGFIGINFSYELLSRGDEVTIFDNLSRKGTRRNVEWLKGQFPHLVVIEGDIRTDSKILAKFINKSDVVYHLAGQVAVTTSVTDPREDFEINALGTFNVLEACRLADNPPTLIYASTNKVYGGMSEISIVERKGKYDYKDYPEGITEKQLLDFHSPYGCSKGAGDQYVRDYARIYSLPTVVMRQSCIYGPNQFGVEDQGWVAWFTIAAQLDKQISIYGDGKQVRDVLFVKDLFKAWDIATKKISVSKGEIYNVGGGRSLTLSLLELVSLLETQFKKEIPLTFSDWRPGDQPVYISDISKIKQELGWEPTTTVEEGIEQLAKWVQKNKKLFLA